MLDAPAVFGARELSLITKAEYSTHGGAVSIREENSCVKCVQSGGAATRVCYTGKNRAATRYKERGGTRMDSFVFAEITGKTALYEEAAALIREAFGTVAREFGLTAQNAPTNGAFMQKERLIADEARGNRFFFAQTKQGETVGFFELEPLREDGGMELAKLAVAPKARHLGCGAAMLAQAATFAGAAGAKWLSIGIIEENLRLKNWYAAHGFVHAGTKKFAHLPFTVGFMYLPLGK